MFATTVMSAFMELLLTKSIKEPALES